MTAEAGIEVQTWTYTEPVSQLLNLGEDLLRTHDTGVEWNVYLERWGFDRSHAPELLRMATNADLYGKDEPVWCAPIHAWRVLGVLRAEEAIVPLLDIAARDLAGDWASEELSVVFRLIGPSALPALRDYLADETKDAWARILCTESIEQLAKTYPEICREECVGILMRQLERLIEQPPEGHEDEVLWDIGELAGFVVSSLTKLKALEAVPLIERAFVEERVDESIMGNLEDVLVEIGEKAPSPEYLAKKERLRASWSGLANRETQWSEFMRSEMRPGSGPSSSRVTKGKNKRKAEKQARKKNRR